MNEELLGLLGATPEQIAQARQRSGFEELGLLGQALMQAGAPAPRGTSTLGRLGQAAGAYTQAPRQTMDTLLQDLLRKQQVEDMQRKQQAEVQRQAAFKQLQQRPGLTEEQRLGITAFPEMARDVLFPKPEEAKIVKPGEVVVRGNEVLFELPKPAEPIKYDRVDLGNSIAFIDPTTLQTAKVIQKTVDPKDTTSGEDSLRKDFYKEASPYISISQAYRKIEEAAKVPSAAGDVSLIFAFMKILDPGSVVREGEFATAAQAAGIPDQVRAQYNAAINGQKLAPAQRQDFLNQAKNLARSQQQMFNTQLYTQFQYIAQQRGFDEKKVLTNPFEGLNLSATQPKPAGRSGPIRQTQDEKSLINKFLTPRQ
jgi:hypothetical protein